jgi:arylsulfatase A-like enzyme
MIVYYETTQPSGIPFNTAWSISMAKNVVFVAFDDLFNVVRFREVYGEPFRTPNIDRLLAMGTYFDGAHAISPICNPSRTATLTGQSPFHTGIENNKQAFFELVDPSTTLPYLFKEAGYTTATVGKIFHGIVGRDDLSSDQAVYLRQLFDILQPTEGSVQGSRGMRPSEFADYKTAAWASDFVRSEHEQPWFLAVGFLKPHREWVVPDRYYKLYDRSKVILPENPRNDFDDIPLFFQQFFDEHRHDRILEAGTWAARIVRYMASISFADAQLGTLLRALDRTEAGTTPPWCSGPTTATTWATRSTGASSRIGSRAPTPR